MTHDNQAASRLEERTATAEERDDDAHRSYEYEERICRQP